MKISLIHPSRGRPQKAMDTAISWIQSSGINHVVEHILMIDLSDKTEMDYRHIHSQYKSNPTGNYSSLHGSDSTDVVQATNKAASLATGDILVYLSDDFKCQDKWGELVIKEFENENRPLVLRVDDCLQEMHTAIITIPIMNRQLYNKLGYFWHPAYKSMHVDEDLYWTAMSIGAIKNCPHLKFPHEHYSNGKAVHDETYRRSEANWDQGKETFRMRKLQKFPI